MYWEEVKKASDHYANNLKFESKAPTDGLSGLELESIYSNDYFPGPNGLDRAFATGQNNRRPSPAVIVVIPPVPGTIPSPMITTPTMTMTVAHDSNAAHQNVPAFGMPAPVSTPPATSATMTVAAPSTTINTSEQAATMVPTPAIHAVQGHAPANVANQDVTSSTASAYTNDKDDLDDDVILEDEGERYDPQSIVEDFLDDVDARHNQRHHQYVTEKQRLIGEVVSAGNRNQSLNWTVRPDVRKDEVPEDKEFNKVGIHAFDFKNMTESSPSGDQRDNKRINLLSLLIYLWPGKWQEQVKQLNHNIRLKNEKASVSPDMDVQRLCVK